MLTNRFLGISVSSLVLMHNVVCAQGAPKGAPSFGANPNAASAGVMKMWERGGPSRPVQIPINPVCRPGSWHGFGGPCHQRPWANCWSFGAQGYYGGVQYVGVPAYASGYYPAYGFDGYSATLEAQNLQLQMQLEQAMLANRQLQQNLDGNRGRINVPVRKRRNDEQADSDRIKNLQAKAKQTTLAANRLFAGGSYARAADRYREATRSNPDEASNYFLLAQSQFAARQFADAARALKDALKINPDWIEADFDLRSLYGNADDWTTQVAELARMVKANPLDRDANFLLGFELFMSGQKDKARTILEQSARLETNDRHLRPFFDYYEKQANAN